MLNSLATLLIVLIGVGLAGAYLLRKRQAPKSGDPIVAPPSVGQLNASASNPSALPTTATPTSNPAEAHYRPFQAKPGTLARDLRAQGRIIPAGTRITILAEHGGGSAYDIEVSAPDRHVVTAEADAVQVL